MVVGFQCYEYYYPMTPQIVQNLHTVMVYQSLCGLMPLLATLGGSGVGQGRGPSHVKLTVPLVELTGQAMRSTLAILEVLSTETAEEVF